jgi:hypothetical protein
MKSRDFIAREVPFASVRLGSVVTRRWDTVDQIPSETYFEQNYRQGGKKGYLWPTASRLEIHEKCTALRDLVVGICSR